MWPDFNKHQGHACMEEVIDTVTTTTNKTRVNARAVHTRTTSTTINNIHKQTTLS